MIAGGSLVTFGADAVERVDAVDASPAVPTRTISAVVNVCSKAIQMISWPIHQPTRLSGQIWEETYCRCKNVQNSPDRIGTKRSIHLPTRRNVRGRNARHRWESNSCPPLYNGIREINKKGDSSDRAIWQFDTFRHVKIR